MCFHLNIGITASDHGRRHRKDPLRISRLQGKSYIEQKFILFIAQYPKDAWLNS
jgi:hypothetical protein